MNDEINLPNMPGYIPIKEAAKKLGVSANRVYTYIEEGRLSGVRAAHVIMIPTEEVENFKPQISGRPRKSIPIWRKSPDDNTLLMTLLLVQVREGQHDTLIRRLEEIRQGEKHIFPGTIARYVAQNEIVPNQVEIILIWRSTVMPNEIARMQALEEFQQAFEDVLDWKTAHYSHSNILIHT